MTTVSSCLGGESRFPKVKQCSTCGWFYSSAEKHDCPMDDEDHGHVLVTYVAIAVALLAIAAVYWGAA